MEDKTNEVKPKTAKANKVKNKTQDVRKQLLEVISNLSKIPKEKIEKYGKDNFSELGLDSFALVEIVFSIENMFDINIPQDSLVNIHNFEELVVLVTGLVNKNG